MDGSFEKLNYVKVVKAVGNKIKVEVENIGLNKNMLLRSALEHQVDLVKFEITNDTLEEIFIKLVVEK